MRFWKDQTLVFNCVMSKNAHTSTQNVKVNFNNVQRNIRKFKKNPFTIGSTSSHILNPTDKKDLYQLIIETANEGVWIKNEEHVTTFLNEKMALMLGYSIDEMIGRPIFDFMFEKDVVEIQKVHTLRQDGVSSSYELRFRSKSNEEVWTHINGSPLFDKGKFVGSLGMVSNITTARIKEQKRIEQERRYKSLFEDSPVPTWDEDFSQVKTYIDQLKASGVTDIRAYFESNQDAVNECSAKMIVNDINTAVVELNEAPDKEYMLQNYAMLIDSKSTEYAINQFVAIAEGQKSCEFDAELRTFNDNIVHVHLKWTVVKGYEDTYEKVYLSTTDLTDRIVAENTTLRQSNHQKELLLKEIHHRVKNNLQIITSLLKLQANSIDDDRIIELFDLSLHRINSMALVHDLLYRSDDFSKIKYGEYLERLVTPLVDAMKQVGSDVNLELEVKDISLNINTSIPLGLLINEIITNSLKHGFVDRSTGEIYVRISALEAPNFVLEIGDNGIGFTEIQDIEKAETLGLQLITSLADQLQGEVVRLSKGEGTHYRIAFQELIQKLTNDAP